MCSRELASFLGWWRFGIADASSRAITPKMCAVRGCGSADMDGALHSQGLLMGSLAFPLCHWEAGGLVSRSGSCVQPLSLQSAGFAHLASSRGTAEVGHGSFLGWCQRGNLEVIKGNQGKCEGFSRTVLLLTQLILLISDPLR